MISPYIRHVRRAQPSVGLSRNYVRSADAALSSSYGDIVKLGGVDCVIADPPYCLLRPRHTRDALEGRVRSSDSFARFASVKEYATFTQSWVKSTVDVLRPQGRLIVWTNALGRKPIMQAVAQERPNFSLVSEFVWAKMADNVARAVGSTANEINLRVYETALVFSPPSNPFPTGYGPGAYQLPVPSAVVTGYHDDSGPGPWKRAGDATDGSVRPAGSRPEPHEHPHHKPFAALEPLIRTWTRPGDTVLDPFAGSGAILAAAVRLGRKVHGLEIDPYWAGVANKAIADAAAMATKDRP